MEAEAGCTSRRVAIASRPSLRRAQKAAEPFTEPQPYPWSRTGFSPATGTPERPEGPSPPSRSPANSATHASHDVRPPAHSAASSLSTSASAASSAATTSTAQSAQNCMRGRLSNTCRCSNVPRQRVHTSGSSAESSAIVFSALSATDSHLLRPRVGEHPRRTLELASRAQRELAGRVRDRRRLLRPRPVLLVAEVHARVLVAQPGPVLLQPFGRRLAQVGDEDQRAALVPLVAAHRGVVDAAVAVVRHPAFALGAVGERRPFTGFGVGLIERRERHQGVSSVVSVSSV